MTTTALQAWPPREHRLAAESAKLLVDKIVDRGSSSGGAVFAKQQDVPMHRAVVLSRQEPVRIDAGVVSEGGDRVNEKRPVRDVSAIEQTCEIDRRQVEVIGRCTEVVTRLARHDRADALSNGPDFSRLATTKQHDPRSSWRTD